MIKPGLVRQPGMKRRFTAEELVGVHEAAELLGITKARLCQLARTYRDFPQPVLSLHCGRIWDVSDISDWAKRHPRREK